MKHFAKDSVIFDQCSLFYVQQNDLSFRCFRLKQVNRMILLIFASDSDWIGIQVM